MTIVPQAVGSLAAFERIQQYLLQPPRCDERLVLRKTDDALPRNCSAICAGNVIIRATPSMPPILTDINLDINKGSIVICSGPVGSGKTTLAKALMGEIPTAGGTVSVSSKRIGSCTQSPWLPSGTLKEAICGFSPEDPTWYDQVVRLCCLDEDISALPQGDETQIGSRGLNLSGGQRQRVVCFDPDPSFFFPSRFRVLATKCLFVCRSYAPVLRRVICNIMGKLPKLSPYPLLLGQGLAAFHTNMVQALARAVYARCEIVVLDDPLSALDGKTETSIVENLLGPQGLFKRMATTVFLITNSGKSKVPLSQR